MAALPTNVSESTRKRNPHLFGGPAVNPSLALGREIVTVAPAICVSSRNLEGNFGALLGGPVKKRIRQSDKPLNKLEREWQLILSVEFPNYPRPRAQAKKYRLANGAWYLPDFSVSTWPDPHGPSRETCWECKGPKVARWSRRGELTIKFAAAAWPEVQWILVWKERGEWQVQDVKA